MAVPGYNDRIPPVCDSRRRVRTGQGERPRSFADRQTKEETNAGIQSNGSGRRMAGVGMGPEPSYAAGGTSQRNFPCIRPWNGPRGTRMGRRPRPLPGRSTGTTGFMGKRQFFRRPTILRDEHRRAGLDPLIGSRRNGGYGVTPFGA